MRIHHVVIAFLLAGWMCCGSTVYVRVSVPSSPSSVWGDEQARPDVIGQTKTISESLNWMDLAALVSQYANVKVETKLFDRTGDKPPMLYVKAEQSAVWDVYLLPNLECCRDQKPRQDLAQK